jgi:hypothetical protein
MDTDVSTNTDVDARHGHPCLGHEHLFKVLILGIRYQ